MSDGPDDGTVIDGAHVFGSQLAKEAALVGTARARADAEERRAWALERIAVAAEIVDAYDQEWISSPKRLSKLFKSAASKVALDVLRGEIVVQNASQAAAVITALVNAGRLEAGEHTTSNAEITTQEREESIKELLLEADRRIEAAGRASGAQVTPLSS